MADRTSRPNLQCPPSCTKPANPLDITQLASPKPPPLPSPYDVNHTAAATTTTTTIRESQTQMINGSNQPTPTANPSQTRRQITRTLSDAPSGADQPPNVNPRRNTLHSFGPDNPLTTTEPVRNHLRSFSGIDQTSSARPPTSSINRNHRILGGSASNDEQAQTFNSPQFLDNERSWDAFTDDNRNVTQWEAFLKKYSNGEFDNLTAPPRPPGRWRGMIRYATRSAPASLRYSVAPPLAIPAFKANSDNSNSTGSTPPAADMESDPVDYLQPPLPSDELERRRALYKFRILGTNPDINFDRIVDICKEVFEVEICLISLVNIDTQWFKSEKGLGCRSTGRGESFCAHAILRKQDDPLVVLDAREDWRFKNNPLVVDSPFIRFYAGAPLRTREGYAIGTLCIIDSKPCTFFPKAKRDLLVKFASSVMHEIYLWSDRAHLKSFKLMHENFGQYQKLCLEAEQEQTPKGHLLLMSLDDRDRKHAAMQHEFDVACHLIREGLDVDKVILAKIYPGSVVQSRWKDNGNGSAGDTKAGSLERETHTVVVCSDEDLPSSVWGTENNVDDEAFHNTVKHLEYHFDNANRRPSSSFNSSSTLPNPPRLRFLSSSGGDEAPSYLSDSAILELLEQSPEVIPLLTNGAQVNQGAIFQNNFPISESSGYCSAIVVPTISSSSSAPTLTKTGPLPFGVLIALTKNPIRQLEWEEMAYLYNFGVSIVSQVVKRSVVVADRAKSAFISGISHELRTPLHGILAVLELLIPPSLQSPLAVRQTPQSSDIFSQPVYPTQSNQCNYDPLTPTQSALLQTIESCGKSLISIINNVLDLAKLESGKRKVDSTECVSFVGLVEEVGEAMFGGVYSKNVEFLVSVEDEDEMVRLKDWRSQNRERTIKGWRQRWVFKSDAGCLRQILLNLVGNALKFTTEGFVHLCLSRPANVPCMMSGGVVKHPIMFTVSDSGCGISQAFMRSRLFQPFSQEDPLQQGTGLGLRICFELVERMGGRIEVESSGVPGQGSVFRVLIWCEEELHHPADKMPKIREASQMIEGKKIRLLIDETKKFKKVLEKYLTSWWALHLLKSEDPDEEDLVLLDNDIGLLQAILTNSGDQWKSKEPHILFLTSLANHGTASAIVANARKGFGYGGNVVLVTKPAGPSKLLAGMYECFVPSDVITTAENAPSEDMMSDMTPGEGSSGQRTSVSSDSYFTEHSTPQKPRTPKTLDSSAQTDPSAQTVLQEREDEHFGSSLPSVQIDEIRSSPLHHTSRTVSYFDPHAIRVPPDTGLITPPGIELPSPYIYHRSQEIQDELQHLQQIVRRPSLPITLPAPISANTIAASLTQSRSKKCRSFPSTPEVHTNEKDLSNSRSSLPASGKTSPEATSPIDTPDPGPITSSSPVTAKILVTPSPAQIPSSTPPVLPHVLIVEDNAVNRLILVTFLRKRGVSFLEAENGAIGVKLFQNEMTANKGVKGFDVVLMDINMPVMNGNLATAEIRRIESENGILPEVEAGKVGPDPTRRRSIIYALTGLASAQDKRVAFECGVDGFLTKPVSLKVLAADVLDNYFPKVPVSSTSATALKSEKTPPRLEENAGDS